MWFPGPGLIVDIHDRILERGGGEPGVLNMGPVRSALDRAMWGPFPSQGDLFERAALILRAIAQDHPFVDGNKRTAFDVASTFLEHNGQTVGGSDEEVVTFMLRVARGEQSVEEIADWLGRHAAERLSARKDPSEEEAS